MESGTLVPAVRLDGYQAHSLMSALRSRGTPLAESLWERVYKAWTYRGIAHEITVPLSAREVQMVRKLGASNRLPGVVDYKFLAVYRHPDFPQQEVRLRSVDRPPKKRTFRVSGHGRKKFKRRKLYRIKPKPPKESVRPMASTKSKSKTKKKQNTKPVEEDDDELEGLEELEDLEDEDVEEPEAEEDEEDEDEEPAPKKSKKAARKTNAKDKKRKAKKAVVEDDEDEEEEDEEDDEEEVPAAKKSKSKKSKGKVKAEAKKEQKKQAKGKGTGKKSAAGKTTAEATGGVGTAELAEAASEIAEVDITGRDVRVYLRSNEIEKDEEHGRYVWPSTKNKAFVKLAKAIAKEYED